MYVWLERLASVSVTTFYDTAFELRRLCERGIFANNNGTVSSLLSKDEFFAVQSEQFVEETFEGSLPAFIAAFTQRNKLSSEEISEIQKMIENARKEQ